MRLKNTRPTNIYWLVDIRPETISAGWSNGQPFYCGKTVKNPLIRLNEHRSQAVCKPHGKVGPRILKCGEFVRVQVVEIVPVGGDWCARERHWIKLLRGSFDALNVADGGQGSAGVVHNLETRIKRSLALKGKKRSAETCERMRKANLGKTLSVEHRNKLSVSHAGKMISNEQRTKIACGLTGFKRPPMTSEHRQKLREAKLGKKQSSAHVAKRAVALTGRKRSAETRIRMSVAQTLRFAGVGANV